MRDLDPYVTLEVSQFASEDVIRAAHQALSRRYRPRNHSETVQPAFMQARLDRALEILLDPVRRKAYDEEREREIFGDLPEFMMPDTTRETTAAASPVSAPPPIPRAWPIPVPALLYAGVYALAMLVWGDGIWSRLMSGKMSGLDLLAIWMAVPFCWMFRRTPKS